MDKHEQRIINKKKTHSKEVIIQNHLPNQKVQTKQRFTVA